uniref:Xyloglucan endotransglucosylase/hydrolase n=1 Tax=Picea sitchensis TaxID=3332 RepID=A9NTM6_PICSI|nr:unknown [Picea sitchensis]
MKSRVSLTGSRRYSPELVYISLVIILNLCSVESSFNNNFEISWGTVRLLNNSQTVQLTMDKASGSGFQSINQYLFGSVSVGIKLVSGNSAGTVTSYYMSSEGSFHDELDFEFLGNLPGKPYVLQTNVFGSGVGNREQRFHLWFDPTMDFHNYSILWNHQQIVFWVDSTPIRVFKNNEAAGVPYLNRRPMKVISSLWNGEDWATDGGRVKTDWSKAPFVASYQSFEVDACSVSAQSSSPCANDWWDQSGFQSLNQHQLTRLDWVRKNYMTYDYCRDASRFPKPPTECALNP